VSDPEPTEASEAPDQHVVDVLADEASLARAQMDAGLAVLAEGTVRRRLAHLEADGVMVDDETDALRLLLAEALWRQARPAAARAALDAVRSSSAQRRLPIALLVEAETLAATGESDRAAGAQERLIAAIGTDGAHALVAGIPGRLSWPLPAEMAPGKTTAPQPPWVSRSAPADDRADTAPDGARIAAGRQRLEEARVAYIAADLERGDAEMAIAMRLDPGLAADGVALLEPTLGGQPAPERLLLYGDLLGAAGREAEATRAYDRAAERRGGSTST
jgi:hypothetical protein